VSSPRRRWLLIPGVMLLCLITILMGHRLAVQSHSPLTLLPDDYRTGGGAGLFLWAQKLSIPTREVHGPLWELNQELSGEGNCVVTAGDDSWNPYAEAGEESVTSDQWNAVQRWIETGNTLIVVTSDHSSLPDQLEDRWTTSPKEGAQPHFSSSNLLKIGSQPSSAEVPTPWGGHLAVSPSGPRLENAPPDWIIAGTPESAVLLKRDFGKGKLYLLLDRDAWANAGLDHASNAVALYRIIEQGLGPSGVLAVDQYRHGRGRVESFATYLMTLPGSTACVCMLLLVGVYWIWARNRRLGPPEEYHEIERRTAKEYVEAVAAMNMRARAAPLAVKAVSDRVLSLLRQRGVSTADSRELEQQADEVIARKERPSSPRTETALVTDLINLRKQLYGSREDSGSGVANEGGAAKGVLRPSGRR
jgi:hypothetical protein